MGNVRVSSGSAETSRPTAEEAVGDWHLIELANRGDSWWFALQRKLQRPQEKPPWLSTCVLKVSATHSLSVSINALPPAAEDWVRNGYPIELSVHDLGRNLVVGGLSIGVCFPSGENIANSQYLSLPSLSVSWNSRPHTVKMAPRLRATPRRGRNAGFRGGTGGRGRSPPQRISPIAVAYPSSQVSEESESSLNNSVQTAKFRFKSRLNKPIVTAMVTVIFSEEEEEQVSSENSEKEHSPTPLEDSSQEEDLISAQSASTDQSPSPRINAVQRQLEEHSISHLTEGMEGKAQGTAGPQHVTAHSDKAKKRPDNTYPNLLQLRLPPGVKPTDVEDGLMVTWERVSDEEKDHGDDEPR